jgi:hypothetical protein
MCMSVFSIISLDNCNISLNTPWAAGCCGPKFKIIFLFLLVLFKEFQLKKKLKFIKYVY